ncbi:MAG TPA: MFS transporter [Opitutaceae bacterium]|nr:MFS transporter [Opitutaceae bacterium]
MTSAAPPSPADRAPTFPGARRALVLLLLINLFNYIDRNVLAAVVPSLRATFFSGAAGGAGRGDLLGAAERWAQAHLGFKPENALLGVLGTAFMVIYTLGAPVFGRLAERCSRWLLIGIAVMLWSLASGASGLAATFGALLLTRCFVGIGEAAYGPVAPALLSDFFPVRIRGQVLAWFYMAIPVGSALGYVLGERVAHSGLGAWGARLFGGPADSWRWAFYLVVGPGLLLGLAGLFLREPPRGQADFTAAAPAAVRWRDYLVLLRTPSYVYCTLGMTAMTFAIGGINFWMPTYLTGRPGVGSAPVTTFGLIVVVTGLAATYLGGLAGDRLRARFPGSYFLVSGAAMLAGFPLFLAVLRTPFPHCWLLIFLACFCLFFNTGPTNTILANVSHPSMRAAAFALNIFVIHTFGDVISPVVIGVLSDRYSMNLGFLVVGVMFLAAGVCWLLGARHLARDTARAPGRLADATAA